jgi:hypothetical protein
MAGNCADLSSNDAESLVSSKWNRVETVAANAVAAAHEALAALTSETSVRIAAAGLTLDGFNFSDPGAADVAFSAPAVPELPDLDVEEFNTPTVASIGIYDPDPGISNSRVPQFTESLSGTNAIHSLNIPPLSDFTSTYAPQSISPYVAPAPPAAFTGAYTPNDLKFELIAKPAAFTGQAPNTTVKSSPSAPKNTLTSPPAISLPSYPASPGLSMPALMAEVTIPLPTLRIPDLSGIDELLDKLLAGQPTQPTLTLPENGFLDTFNGLRSTLGGELEPVLPIEEVLTWMLSGQSIGIPASVALMLRERAFQAEDQQAFQAEDVVLNQWAARGFTLPGGALAAEIDAIRQKSRDKIAALNRDLWIEEAKLEIEALREAIKMGIQYQSALWESKNRLWATCGDLATKFTDVQVKVLEVTLAAYRAQIDAWQAEASVIKDYLAARLQAELSKLEITKVEAQLSGLFVQINGQHVDLYKAQMDGVMAEVNVYRAQIDAANGLMQGESIKLEAYAKQVQAYSTAVQAYEAEWRGYAAAVQADVAQVDAYKATIQAYSAQVDAYGKEVDAARSQLSAEVELEKLGLDAFKTRAEVYNTSVEVYSKQVLAEKTRIEAEVEAAKLPLEAYKADAQVYAAESEAFGQKVRALAAQTSAEVDIAKLPVELFEAKARAYSAQVDGYGKSVDAERLRATTFVDLARLDLDQFKHKLDVYRAELQRTGIEVDAKARIHGSQVQLYSAQVGSEQARVQAELQVVAQNLQRAQFQTSTELKKAELEQAKVLAMADLAQKADSEVGRIASQLAAAALSATNASAQVSNSYGKSQQSECSTSYVYSLKG